MKESLEPVTPATYICAAHPDSLITLHGRRLP